MDEHNSDDLHLAGTTALGLAETAAGVAGDSQESERKAREGRRGSSSSSRPPSPPRSTDGAGVLGSLAGKGKEREDVLPYLQNAALEQQTAQAGPLPIHRSAAELAALASTSATSVSPTASSKMSTKGATMAAGPFAQPPPLSLALHQPPPPRLQQYSPPPLAVASVAVDTRQENVLPYMQNAVLEQQSAAGEKPLPIQRFDTNNPNPSTTTASFTSPRGAGNGSGAIVQPTSTTKAQTQPPAARIFSPIATAPSISAQPPPLGHHALSVPTSATASAASQHTVLDAHSGYQPQHVVSDHALGGHATHIADTGSCMGNLSGHHAISQPVLDHIGHHAIATDQFHVGHAVSAEHAPESAHALSGHHIPDTNHHALASHVLDGHADPRALGGHHFAIDAHHIGHQTHTFDGHAQSGFSHIGGEPRHHVEYNFGGGHHAPDFTTPTTASGGQLSHVLTPPQTLRTAEFASPTSIVRVTAEGVPQADTFDVKEPSLLYLILLLIIIPVLSLSPYWGYHGPSSVSIFMMEEFGISYIDLGLMFTLYSLPNLFMPFVAGSLINKWGLSVSSLLFNILCLAGNVMLAITYYMPSKPISLLLISRVIFGFGGEAIIVCQQVMLTRWFSGTSLVLASGFVQIFVLSAGSGGAFLFLPHFDEDGVNISLLHILFVSFWGFVFNLFYIACEWKWTPWLLSKRLRELQQTTVARPRSIALPLSRPVTTASVVTPNALSYDPSSTPTASSHVVEDSHFAGPSQHHLALAPADSHIVPFGSVDNHHAVSTPLVGGGCMGGHLAGVDSEHHYSDAHHIPAGLAHHADQAHFDGHALSSLNVHTPQQPVTAPPATRSTTADGWGFFRIEGRAQIFTPNGREVIDNIILEGGGQISGTTATRKINVQYATGSVSALPPPPPAAPSGGLLASFLPTSPSQQRSTPIQTSKPTPAPSTNPFLFYPRVFTSPSVGEDLQNLPAIFWLVAAMIFCIAPVFPAFTAFAPLYFQEKFGFGAVSASRAASLVYCIGAATPFAAFIIAKLRVRSFIQLLAVGGVAGILVSFYSTGDESFLPWFLSAALGLIYCFVLGSGYAWVELTVPSDLLGTATTLSLVITNAGLALAPFLVGLVRELSSDFDGALLVLVALAGTGFFFASLVLVVDIRTGGVLIGAEPETEAERAEAQRLRALKRALAEAEEAKLRQLELEKAQEQAIEEEIRVEVERLVRQRRAARSLPPQQPLPLAPVTTVPSTSTLTRPPGVSTSSSSSPSVGSSAAEAPERIPLLSPQLRARSAASTAASKKSV